MPNSLSTLVAPTEPSKKYNTGVWSENLVAFMLIVLGKVWVADTDSAHPVEERVLYSVHRHGVVYSDLHQDIITITKPGTASYQISKTQFGLTAQAIQDCLCALKNAKKGLDAQEIKGIFALPLFEQLAKKIHLIVKPAKSRKKDDITLCFRSLDTGGHSKLFLTSIKSFFGSDPSIFNASKASKLCFCVENVSAETLFKLKQSSARNAVQNALHIGAQFSFSSYLSPNMKARLEAFHDAPLLAYSVLEHFKRSIGGTTLFQGLASDQLKGYPCMEHFFKSVLHSCVLGFTATQTQQPQSDIADSMLILQEDGQLCCIMGRQRMEEVLYDYSYIDTPSRSRTKYGVFYQDHGQTFIQLNFSIRLKPIQILPSLPQPLLQ